MLRRSCHLAILAASSLTSLLGYNCTVTVDTVPGGALRAHAREVGRDAKASKAQGKPRRRATVSGVLGEILITVGVVTLLYVVWQLWVGDLIYEAENTAEATELSQQWQQEYTPPEQPAAPTETVAPVILPEPADAEVFGIMRVPRWGPDNAVQMAGGVTRERTLNPIGVGHYPGAPMPGDVGNVSFAAHRTTYGKPFNRIAELRVGDAIVIEVPEGWYVYRFRTLEYVTPNAIDVLTPVPQVPDSVPGDRYITLTSCSPMYNLTERIVAYGVFESWTPRADGPPAALTEGV